MLACLDGYMNIAMEQTEVRARRGETRARWVEGIEGREDRLARRVRASERDGRRLNAIARDAQEYVNGQLKNKYGDAFIRGNNGA